MFMKIPEIKKIRDNYFINRNNNYPEDSHFSVIKGIWLCKIFCEFKQLANKLMSILNH